LQRWQLQSSDRRRRKKKEKKKKKKSNGAHPVSRWKGRRPSKPGRLVTTRPEPEEAQAASRKTTRAQREQRRSPGPAGRRRRCRGPAAAAGVIIDQSRLPSRCRGCGEIEQQRWVLAI